MKKFLRLLLVLVTIVTLTACGDKKVESLVIKHGLEKTSYAINETIDTSGIVVIAKYNDDTQKEVTAENLKITGVSTATAGNKKLTIAYKGQTVDIYYTVLSDSIGGEDPEEPASVTIMAVEAPRFVTLYNNNIKENANNKEAEFFVRNNGYKVGDDNAFKFMPNITALDENENPILVNNYKSVSTISIKEEGSYRTITGLDRKNYVEVNDETSEYDFTEHAIGHTFKLSVYPASLSSSQLGQIAKYTQTFEFTVVDGYNVYSAAGLSILNNEEPAIWESYKSTHNIPTDKIAGVILHDNLQLKTSDFPSYYFYQSTDDGVVTHASLGSTEKERQEQYQNKAVVGTMKDNETFYYYNLAKDESFSIYGNYFTIDASTLPVVSDYGFDGSNSQLFKFTSQEGDTNVTITNLNLLGNSLNYIGEGNERELAPNNMGGLIGFKLSSEKHYVTDTNTARIASYTVDNVIAKGFFMNFMPERQKTQFLFKNVKSFDTYGNSLFLDRQTKVSLENCQFTRSGGPLIITQYTWTEGYTTEDDYISLDIDSATIENGTESWLYGLESWFESYGYADDFASIVALNAVLNGYGIKGYVVNDGAKGDKINVLAAMTYFRYESSDTTTFGKVILKIDGKTVIDTVNTDPAVNPLYAQIMTSYNAPGDQKPPLFVNSEGDYAFLVTTDGVNFRLTRDLVTFESILPTDNFFKQGEYVTLYQNGMAFVLGYDTTPIAA